MIILSIFINVSSEDIKADNLFSEDFNMLNFDESRNYQKYSIESIIESLDVNDQLVDNNEYKKLSSIDKKTCTSVNVYDLNSEVLTEAGAELYTAKYFKKGKLRTEEGGVVIPERYSTPIKN